MGLKIGLIGCGRQAPKHVSGMRAWGDVEIMAADEEAARARALAAGHGVRAVCDAAAIFADPDIAAVSICTPPASHGALVAAAIAAGKHFICEKPLTADLAEARALEDARARAGLVGMVGYIYRFAPAFRLGADALAGARDGAEAAALGRVTQAFFRIGGPGSHDLWQHRRGSHGGAVNEMLVHMVDLAVWYFGPMRSGRILASRLRQPERTIRGQRVAADAEDWIVAELVSRGGVDILVEADLTTPTFLQYGEVHGSNGSFMGSIQPDMTTFIHCLAPRAGFAAGRRTYDFGARNLFEAQMGLFLDCVAGTATLDRCTLGETLELMQALELLAGGVAEQRGEDG